MARILVIDDDDICRGTVRTSLIQAGHSVLEAVDGQVGVVTALRQLPDLIVCDVAARKLDGFQLFQILRSDRMASTIPFLFMSGLGTIKGKGAMKDGPLPNADDVLVKPFSSKDLMRCVERILSKQRDSGQSV